MHDVPDFIDSYARLLATHYLQGTKIYRSLAEVGKASEMQLAAGTA